MRHQATRDLHAFWDRVRGERAAPERTEIDPVAIRSLLGDTFMLEADPARHYPFCLAGERINGLFNRGMKDTSFIELWPMQERRQIASLCASVCDDTVPIVAGLVVAPQGHDPLPLEMLLLPLRHRGKTHSRILGVVSALAPPPWYGILPVQHFSLLSMRVLSQIGGGRRPIAGSAIPARRSGETALANTPAQRRAHLTVYQGGR